jgi:hypothetical protein
VRDAWPEVERLQLAAARVIIALPSNFQSNADCLNGELGWWNADDRCAMGTIHDTAPTEPQRIAYEYYKSWCPEKGHPDGTWTRRVLIVLGRIGFADVFHYGWLRGEHGGLRVPSDKRLCTRGRRNCGDDRWRRTDY